MKKRFCFIFGGLAAATMMTGCKATPVVEAFLDSFQETYASFISEGAEIATVDDIRITELEMKEWNKAIPGIVNSRKSSLDGKRVLLEVIIQHKVTAALAERDGIDKTPEFRIEARRLRGYLLARMYREKLLKEAALSNDPAIQKLYESTHPSPTSDAPSADHIYLLSQAQVRTVQKLLKGGLAFDIVAKKFTPSFTPKTDLNVEKTLAKLKDGEISAPIKTPDGYEIIRRRPRNAPRTDDIQKRLQNEYVQAAINAEWKKMKAHVDEEALSALKLDPRPINP